MPQKTGSEPIDENAPDQLELTPKKLDEFDLASLVTDPVMLFIIQRLREGPFETDAFHKLLKAKFRDAKKTPREYCELLIQYNFLREYSFERKVAPPDDAKDQFPKMSVGQKANFYILVKDFYAIRKPPVEVLELLEQSDLPQDQIRGIRREIEQFFKSYTAKPITGDDPNVLDLFLDQKMIAAVSYLSKKVYKIAEFQDEFKQQWGTDPTKAFKTLEAKHFVKILSHPKRDEKWVVLLTAIELQPIFPEYLIKNINRAMAEKQLEKEFALVTLNNLKKYYLEVEKPEYLKKLQDKIAANRKKIQEIQEAAKSGKKLDVKGIKGAYNEIIEVYKQIGDLVMIQNITDELEKWEKEQGFVPKK
jgi:hypothetical protein